MVMTRNNCRRCAIDVLHCHGTLVRHDDGGWECSAQGGGGPECTGDADTHDLVLTCAQVWAGCCGAEALPSWEGETVLAG